MKAAHDMPTTFPNAQAAIDYADGWEDLCAVLIDGRPEVTSEDEADALAASGAEFAYLETMQGAIVTVPVN